MSELQRSFTKTKIATIPNLPESDELLEEKENLEHHVGYNITAYRDEDASSESSTSSTLTVKPTQDYTNSSTTRPQGPVTKRKYTPIKWSSFFERELFIESEANSVKTIHHAYLTCPVDNNAPLFVMHHGAGSSGLSFALLALEIRKRLSSAGILSIDARGHGITQSTPVQEFIDLSLDTLSEDLVFILNKIKVNLRWRELPPLVLIGHSLGGAVVTHIVKSAKLESKLLCYAVIDVVEGSAIDALKSMQICLSRRPTNFKKLDSAIEWHVRTRTIRNSKSARVSVPPLLKQNDGSDIWIWRTNLAATQPYWESWFIGMSKKFIEGKAGKMLMLAGTDRLDTELMIAQMQGKFTLQIFPEAGHFIHEDIPEKVALVLADFYNRNDRSNLILPPKVDDMLRAGKKV